MCGVRKGVNGSINQNILQLFENVERMDRGRLVKRLFSGKCVGNQRQAGRPKYWWIELVKKCILERNVYLVKARRTLLKWIKLNG